MTEGFSRGGATSAMPPGERASNTSASSLLIRLVEVAVSSLPLPLTLSVYLFLRSSLSPSLARSLSLPLLTLSGGELFRFLRLRFS
eukprot:scaffold279775_cov28-Tisochrysis_lutea.AAC.3